MEDNPYTAPDSASTLTSTTTSGIIHRVLLAALIVALISFWNPPPQPRYDGSWDPPTVALVALVFYGWTGAGICLFIGLASLVSALRNAAARRDARKWIWVRLNVMTWLCLYAAIPLWNRFIRQPEW